MGDIAVAAYLFSEITKLGVPGYMAVDPSTLEHLRQSWLTLKIRELATTAPKGNA